MYYIPELLTVAAIHLLALMSPGPDSLIVIKNAVTGSRKLGVSTALGVALGMPVHITYSLLGIGFLIAKSIVLFSAIKLIGAGYLIYIGVQALRSKEGGESNETPGVTNAAHTAFTALRSGFLTNALNPKATLFFLALFTQVISHSTPKHIQLLYGLEMTLMTFAWFCLVALVLSHHTVQAKFIGIRHYMDRTLGALLVLLGLKVAFSTHK
jgi:RhtB (resistance to homoserine/threonine) family protein